MGKRKFEVEFKTTVTLELDDEVIAAVDDNWRETFYDDVRTPEDIAAHIGYNLEIMRAKLSDLDGFADKPDEMALIVGGSPDWDVKAEEVKDDEDSGS